MRNARLYLLAVGFHFWLACKWHKPPITQNCCHSPSRANPLQRCIGSSVLKIFKDLEAMVNPLNHTTEAGNSRCTCKSSIIPTLPLPPTNWAVKLELWHFVRLSNLILIA